MDKVLYGFVETCSTVVDGKECHRVDYFKGFDATTASFICTKVTQLEDVRNDARHLANIHGIKHVRFMGV